MSTAVEFKNVDIIFGDNSAAALRMAHAGADRAEILAKTGSVLGATGANLTVNEGEGRRTVFLAHACRQPQMP